MGLMILTAFAVHQLRQQLATSSFAAKPEGAKKPTRLF
jgi:hypothetical protein